MNRNRLKYILLRFCVDWFYFWEMYVNNERLKKKRVSIEICGDRDLNSLWFNR